MVDMDVTLPDEEKNFVDAQVASGGYETTSEYINALILREIDRNTLREKLLAGQRSGVGSVADEAYFARLRRRARDAAALHRENGQAPPI